MINSTSVNKNDEHLLEASAPVEPSKVSLDEGFVVKVSDLARYGGKEGSKVFAFPGNASISALVKAKAISQEE